MSVYGHVGDPWIWLFWGSPPKKFGNPCYIAELLVSRTPKLTLISPQTSIWKDVPESLKGNESFFHWLRNSLEANHRGSGTVSWQYRFTGTKSTKRHYPKKALHLFTLETFCNSYNIEKHTGRKQYSVGKIVLKEKGRKLVAYRPTAQRMIKRW